MLWRRREQHGGVVAAGQGAFQQLRQHGVPVRHVGRLCGQRSHNAAEGRQGPVDVLHFLKPQVVAEGFAGVRHALGPSQIHKRQQRTAVPPRRRVAVGFPKPHLHHHARVAAAAAVVHRRGVRLPLQQQRVHELLRLRHVGDFPDAVAAQLAVPHVQRRTAQAVIAVTQIKQDFVVALHGARRDGQAQRRLGCIQRLLVLQQIRQCARYDAPLGERPAQAFVGAGRVVASEGRVRVRLHGRPGSGWCGCRDERGASQRWFVHEQRFLQLLEHRRRAKPGQGKKK